MLPEQVQLKVCAQKPYGGWECVGGRLRGAECPLLPGREAPRLPASHGENREPGRGGSARAHVCACVCVCARVCMRVHRRVRALRQVARTGVCRGAGGGALLYSEAH